jgi:multiple antibiotic resistance protein
LPAIDTALLVREFVTLLVVIDPIGTLPVFYFAIAGVPRRFHWRIAVRAVLVAALVLYFFLIAGQLLLEAIGLRLGSFQIAGGIVLFLFALTMIFGEAKAEREIEEAERDHMAGAIFPLAIPAIASPGAMLAVVVLTDNNRYSAPDQIVTAILLAVVLGIVLALLLLGSVLRKVIGPGASSVISRVMGIILATIAVDSVLGGMDAVGILDLSDAVGAL